MRMTFMFRKSLVALGLVVLTTSGCAFTPDKQPPDPPAPIPEADTPRNLMIRFREIYQQRQFVHYEKLFTSDFRFQFSAATDPELAAQYGDNWGLDNEISYAQHLFDGGGTDQNGQPVPPATRITMNLDPFPIDDPARPDSSAHYKTLIVPLLHVEIEIPDTADPAIYTIEGRYQFWMVRGDAAHLLEGQVADATRWYIYKWEDQSTPAASVSNSINPIDHTEGELPATPSSWGRLKAVYAQ